MAAKFEYAQAEEIRNVFARHGVPVPSGSPATTGEEAVAINQRSDVCAVPALGVVTEAMVALVLADAVLEKFGGDSVAETARNVRGYLDTLVVK